MLRKLTYVLLVVTVAGAIAWSLVSYNSLLQTRSELSLLRREIGILETNLEIAENTIAETEEELASAQQELSSAELAISFLESELELYKDTWGSVVASGIDRPSFDINLVNCETASNPTWAKLLDFLLKDKTDENAYVPDVYVCRHFARDIHNNAELSGIRAAYVRIELPSGYHALNAFKTTDRGLVFISCTGLETSQYGPSNCDKTVDVRLGERYVPKSLFPESGWSVTWGSMGTIRDVEIYW